MCVCVCVCVCYLHINTVDLLFLLLLILDYSQLEFREELVRQLGNIKEESPVPLYKSSSHTADAAFATDHVIVYSDTRHNCSVCYKLYKVERKCHFTCSSASCKQLNAYFCVNKSKNCFQKWHSAQFNGKRT